jgi:hypothetical protein
MASERSRRGNLESSIYFSEADQHWLGRVSMGTKPDGRPDRRHTMSRGRATVAQKVRQWQRERDPSRPSKPGRVQTASEWMATYLDDTCEATSVRREDEPANARRLPQQD